MAQRLYFFNKDFMKQHLQQSDDHHFIPMTSIAAGSGHLVKDDIFYYTNQIVNVVFIGFRNNKDWVLVDAGMPYSGDNILSIVKQRFQGKKPLAILLTHGHFDHVGGIVKLIEEWQVPVYAHPLEFPFLTGQLDYPEPDDTVEGGLLAKISKFYPHEAINISEVLQPLPSNGTVPGLQDWKWIHTPGHSPGHVSFFREKDKLLIAGDAFITVRADSFYKVLIQKKEVNGPPRYFTTDWVAAKNSVKKLQALYPEIAITGHGSLIEGEELREGLKKLVDEFDNMAVPAYGKFVNND
jgi:glyoxylase-like metal-dependent hydrolase (beta-lactamase superfamily II)